MTAEPIDEGIQESDEEPKEIFECVVCCKVFKSEKQLDAHEKSRKHIKAVDRLRKDMRGEAKALDLNNGVSSAISTPAEKDNDGVSSTPGYDTRGFNDIKNSEPDAKALDLDNGVSRAISKPAEKDDEDVSSTLGYDTRGVNDINIGEPDGEEVVSELSGTGKALEVVDCELLASPDHSSASPTDDEYASREKVEERLLGSNCEKGNRTDNDEHLHDLDRVTDISPQEALDGNRHSPPSRKAGKAKEKRGKKGRTTGDRCSQCRGIHICMITHFEH